MIENQNIAAEVANLLLQINAIKLSPQKPFTWASGLKSPIYCDNRLTLSYPAVRNQLLECFVHKYKCMQYDVPIDYIAGVATAGIPHGAMLADRLGLPFIYVRSKAKAHGRQNQIEGQIQGTPNVLVIEDLISTGGSSLAAVEALRAANCNVIATLAIFTYGFDQSVKAFQEANCPLDTLSNYNALIEIAQAERIIESDQIDLLKQWRQNPHLWSEQMKNA
ncbi:MAG: orotate phosphoribosyltransferase [Bacteroidota bacterium]